VSDDSNPGGPDASLPDTSLPDTSVVVPGPDTSTIDTGTAIDAGADVAVDSALPDTGPSCGTPSIAGFVPPPFVPPSPQIIICDHPADNAVGPDCFGDASTLASCASFPSTGEGRRPRWLGHRRSRVSELPLHRRERRRRSRDACKTACPPVTDDVTRDLFLTCAQGAATTACSSYTQAAAACIASETAEGGPSAGTLLQYCFAGSSLAEQVTALAAFFCTS
jgi:hypothetical protein